MSFLQVGRQYLMRTNAFVKDSYHLGRAVLRESSGLQQLTDTWRNVVTTQARQSNQAAVTVLQIQQQIGLLRYHGMMEYLRQRTRVSSTMTTTTTRASSTSSSSIDNKQPRGAKVAFMITSSMKSQLVEELGYDVQQIKEMTPTQASLILHHKVSPSAMEEELPVLMQQYEEQRAEQEAEMVNNNSIVDKSDVVESDAQPESSEPSTSKTLEQQQEHVLLESTTSKPESVSSNLSLSENEESNETEYILGERVDDIAFGLDTEGSLIPTIWYEIIEIDTMQRGGTMDEAPVSTGMVVAMYQTRKEAQMALELKESFAERQAKAKSLEKPSLVYKIRKSTPEEHA